jgi:hypothetical protein
MIITHIDPPQCNADSPVVQAMIRSIAAIAKLRIKAYKKPLQLISPSRFTIHYRVVSGNCKLV